MTAEIAEAEFVLSRLPSLPDPDALERRWRDARDLAAGLGEVTTLPARAALLRRLGSITFGPSGVQARYRVELQGLFGVC